MRLQSIVPTLALGMISASLASAATVVLKFEDIVPNGTQSTAIGNFYNGAGGPANNFGVEFSENALAVCLNTPGDFCSNASRGGLGDPASQKGGLFFLTGSETFMNFAAGFDTGFSLFYAAVNQGGSLNVYDGLNGTGSILATLALPLTSSACSGYGAAFCPFVPVGVSFGGTAKSIGFSGVANQIAFDDVTFGSATPGGGDVPEPGTFGLAAAALGIVVLRARAKK